MTVTTDEDPDDVHAEGAEAYIMGVALIDCPYHEGEKQFTEWCAGWKEQEELDK